MSRLAKRLILNRATRLTLICRGRTQATKLSGFSSDEPLLDGETALVTGIANTLRRVDRLLCAPEQSARETAAALGVAVIIDAAFRDLDYGRWQDKTLADIAASEPDALAQWIGDASAAPHGGEPAKHMLERVSRWMTQNLAAGGHTVVVTHPIVIKAVVLASLDAPASALWKLDVELLSVTDLRSDGRRWVLRSLARGRHD
jgi:broad specificity phosphatase PhoE